MGAPREGRKLITVRTKRADGTPAYFVYTPCEVARRLGLAHLTDGDAVAPEITIHFQEDGVDFNVAADNLKEGYRVANEWATAIRETAHEPIHIQTVARDLPQPVSQVPVR